MHLHRDRSIGIVVDVQEKIVPYIHEHERLTAAISRLVRGLKILEVPLLPVQLYTKGLGQTVEPLRGLFAGRAWFEKMAFSCLGESEFLRELKLSGRRCVIVAGIESHACVLQTVLDLLVERFIPVVVEDCVGSQRPADKAVAIERMRQEGARITTSESILFELLGISGTEIFRQISAIVKEAGRGTV
jgi:hypothetical protein